MSFSHIFESVPSQDWLIILSLFLGISTLIVLSELLRRYLDWPAEFTRKFVHILVGVMMFFIPILLKTSLPMLLIAAFFALANWIAIEKDLLKGMHGARQSYGTVYYPLSFFILVLLAWPSHVIIIIAPMMVLALADAAAAITGESLSQPHTYSLTGDTKSLEGSVVMFTVSSLVIGLLLAFPPFGIAIPVLYLKQIIWFAGLTALLTTAAEALSKKGSDNLSIPLTSALVLYFLLNHAETEITQFILGVTFGAIAGLISHYLRFLTASGTVATFLLASVIFGFGGWKWTIPILTFFILSSLLSKAGKRIKARYDLIFEKGSQRDYGQVFANGGMAGILMILFMFFSNQDIYLCYLAAIATAAADTWATEVGTLAQQQPRMVTNFRKVAPGASGGITLAGTLGATAGAFSIALAGYFFIGNANFLLLVTLLGLFGSFVDSLFGATLQIQYRCPVCEARTEKKIHCPPAATLPLSGFHWMNNDMVNFLSTVVTALIMFILLHFF